MAVLKGHPPPTELLDRIAVRSGLPAAAFHTLRKHGQLDPEHSRELDRLLDGLPLKEAHTTLIGLSMAQTASSLALGLEELLPPT
jgi:hypothetical protein